LRTQHRVLTFAASNPESTYRQADRAGNIQPDLVDVAAYRIDLCHAPALEKRAASPKSDFSGSARRGLYLSTIKTAGRIFMRRLSRKDVPMKRVIVMVATALLASSLLTGAAVARGGGGGGGGHMGGFGGGGHIGGFGGGGHIGGFGGGGHIGGFGGGAHIGGFGGAHLGGFGGGMHVGGIGAGHMGFAGHGDHGFHQHAMHFHDRHLHGYLPYGGYGTDCYDLYYQQPNTPYWPPYCG
jgi:hypothetical protein